jgi:tetratricopeptide (TPR) repeat protein
MKLFSKSRLWLAAILVGGLIVAGFGYRLLTWDDAQSAYYNAGLTKYQTAQEVDDMKMAIDFFDKSVAIYKQRSRSSTWLERFMYPAPSRERAALAQFHKAKALLRLRQAEPAVEAFKESLRLNPGNDYANLPGFEQMSNDDIIRLAEQSLTVKYDLELLFKNNKQQAEGQGKGKGKGKPQPGQGKKQAPGQEPGDQPGKGKPNTL